MQARRSNRRIQAKLKVFFDNLIKPKRVITILVTIILSIGIVLFMAYLAINFGYLSRIDYTEEAVGEETQQAVVILEGDEIRSTETSAILDKLQTLYIDRKVSLFDFYILNSTESEADVEAAVESKITNFDTELIHYNYLYSDVGDVCANVQEDSSTKGIIFTAGDKIIRSLYLCNFFNLYYTGFKIEESEEIPGVAFVSFSQFISDFAEILFKPSTDEG